MKTHDPNVDLTPEQQAANAAAARGSTRGARAKAAAPPRLKAMTRKRERESAQAAGTDGDPSGQPEPAKPPRKPKPAPPAAVKPTRQPVAARGRPVEAAARPGEKLQSSPRITKAATLEALLRRPEGATNALMMSATGWQAHSVRGFLAGNLKKRGLVVDSRLEGDPPTRVYRIATEEAV